MLILKHLITMKKKKQRNCFVPGTFQFHHIFLPIPNFHQLNGFFRLCSSASSFKRLPFVVFCLSSCFVQPCRLKGLQFCSIPMFQLVRDIKKTKPPIHEFKVLQNVFRMKRQGLKCFSTSFNEFQICLIRGNQKNSKFGICETLS